MAKTEELKDLSTRREVVHAALNLTGAHALSQAALKSSSSEELANLREALRVFDERLAKEHNVHRRQPPGVPSAGGSASATSTGVRSAANNAQVKSAAAHADAQHVPSDSVMAQCEAALSTPQSYLRTCNARLAALLGDEKWLWGQA